MSVKYPSHLYIRIDRPLRADLHALAEATGLNVSHAARELLRCALAERCAARQVTASKSPDRREA